MGADAPRKAELPPASLTVSSPTGGQHDVRLDRVPFRIGRLGDNELVLRDSRISRHHARIVAEACGYAIEDLKSSYGVFVNGERIERKTLRDADVISFGIPDSYRLRFALGGRAAARPLSESGALAATSLAKLRATLEVARALQSSLSTDDVLAAVVEAALAVTGCERGFLLLRKGDDLETRVARSKSGALAPADLRVPTRLLLRALQQRKDFLSMSFDPAGEGQAERTIADLELRSVVCLPLVRVRAGSPQETAALSTTHDTVGLLYMDSRVRQADLSTGSRELLTTLALEASTVLENARLLEEQWARQRIEQELRIAREIQESLLPRALPQAGWFRASVRSIPSLQVGGDYVDVREIGQAGWAVVLADVSGKGVGAALLASLLQGMFLVAPYTRLPIEETVLRVNRFLNERTGGLQYATAFYGTVDCTGLLRWVNAGHPAPLLVRADARIEPLAANGTPMGLLEEAEYAVAETRLGPGDKLLLYSDGLTEARSSAGDYFGARRLRELAAGFAVRNCRELENAVYSAVQDFTRGTLQADDITIAVLGYYPA